MGVRIAMVSEHAGPLVPLGTADAGGQRVYVDRWPGAGPPGRAGRRVHPPQDPAVPAVVDVAPGVWVHHCRPGRPSPLPRTKCSSGCCSSPTGSPRPGGGDVRTSCTPTSGCPAGRRRRAADSRRALVQTFHALGSVKRRHQGAADTSPPERASIQRRWRPTSTPSSPRATTKCRTEFAWCAPPAGRRRALWCRTPVPTDRPARRAAAAAARPARVFQPVCAAQGHRRPS